MAEILWEQTPQRPAQPGSPKQYLLWSTRGKLVIVQGDKSLPELLSKGFVPADKDEIKRFKPGDYFPHYDSSVQHQSAMYSKAEIHNGEVLKILRV